APSAASRGNALRDGAQNDAAGPAATARAWVDRSHFCQPRRSLVRRIEALSSLAAHVSRRLEARAVAHLGFSQRAQGNVVGAGDRIRNGIRRRRAAGARIHGYRNAALADGLLELYPGAQ